MVNNKTYSATKVSLFMANYGRELRIGADIRKKRIVERMKKMQEKVEAILRKAHKKMKRQADRRRKEVEE